MPPGRPVSPSVSKCHPCGTMNDWIEGKFELMGVAGEIGEGDELIDIDEDDHVGEGQDEQPTRVVTNPEDPTHDMIEQHRAAGHLPYRSWCRWCVLGRGIGSQHRTTESTSSVPRVGIDYFFIVKGAIKLKGELEGHGQPGFEEKVEEQRREGKLVKCIVARCWESKNLFAHIIPRKGVDEEMYVANLMVKDIDWLGYSKVIIKHDREPALTALVSQITRILRTRGVDTSTENPPKYDSQSNGGTEIGVRIARGIYRTIKLCLEDRIQQEMDDSHAMCSWILEMAALLSNTRTRGPDGKTPWERIRGRPFNTRMLAIGEKILYKFPTKGPGSQPQGNMGAQWGDAILLGFDWSANTYMISTTEGVTSARTIARRPLSMRWSAEAVMGVKATPWSLRDKPDVEVRIDEDPGERPPRAAPKVPRKFRLNYSDLIDHGFTVGCPQCAHSEIHHRSRDGLDHTTACRQRLMTEIMKTAKGRERIENWKKEFASRMKQKNDKGADQPRNDDAVRGQAPTGGTGEALPQSTQQGASSSASGSASGTSSSSSSSSKPSSSTSTGEASGMSVPRSRSRDHHESDRQEPHSKRRRHAGRDAQEGGASNDEGRTPRADKSSGHNRTRRREHDSPESEDKPSKRSRGNDDDLSHVTGQLGRLSAQADDVIAHLMLDQLCASGGSYRRETKRAMKNLISEVYSPPRVTAELKKRKMGRLVPGLALDLTVIDPDDDQPWDFARQDKREKARRLFREQKPLLLIGSPVCTAWSAWQRINKFLCKDQEKMRRLKVQAAVHLEFVVDLYRDQIERGRYFLHEHPMQASS